MVAVVPKPLSGEFIDDHAFVLLPNRGDCATFVAIDNDVETAWIVTGCCTDIS